MPEELPAINEADVEIRKAKPEDAPKIQQLIAARWDRKPTVEEIDKRIKHGLEYVAEHKPSGEVLAQMSAVITNNFKESWKEHVGHDPKTGALDPSKRFKPNGRIVTFYQLTANPGYKVLSEGKKEVSVPDKLRKVYVKTVEQLFEPILTGKKSFGWFRRKSVEVRTHSPIQDFQKVLFNNHMFNKHVREKFGIKKLETPADFYSLKDWLRRKIAEERLKFTEPGKGKPLEHFVEKCKNNPELSRSVRVYFLEKLSGNDERAMQEYEKYMNALGKMLYNEHRKSGPGTFDRFLAKKARFLVPVGEKKFFGIEDYFDWTERRGEATHLFHRGGGARAELIFPGSEEERSLKMGVSYRYPLPGQPVEQGLIGRMLKGSNLEKEMTEVQIKRLKRTIPPSARK